MDSLGIRYTTRAQKDVDALSAEFRRGVLDDIGRLAEGSLPSAQIKKLQGFQPAVWQVTTGSCRVLFRRDGLVLWVLGVFPKAAQRRRLRAFR